MTDDEIERVAPYWRRLPAWLSDEQRAEIMAMKLAGERFPYDGTDNGGLRWCVVCGERLAQYRYAHDGDDKPPCWHVVMGAANMRSIGDRPHFA